MVEREFYWSTKGSRDHATNIFSLILLVADPFYPLVGCGAPVIMVHFVCQFQSQIRKSCQSLDENVCTTFLKHEVTVEKNKFGFII